MSGQKYDDDEPILDTSTSDDNPGKGVPDALSELGKVPVKFENEPTVPVEDTNYELLLELSGRGASKTRLGADIVMVLDVSWSMNGDKLNEMKKALQFVIRKLSSSDRLSVVTFSTSAERKSKLRQMTPGAREETDFLVQNLKALENTNITAGLEIALKVLDDRRLSAGRSSAIMLMSDGIQNEGGDATKVKVGRYPVFTFGFGKGGEYDSKVLNEIAKESNGGTFSYANHGDLNKAFSQCLGGLLSVLVQDVKLILTPKTQTINRRKKESVTTKINKVYAGNYLQSPPDSNGVITVTFGNLYVNETRSVLVDLFLPAVSKEAEHDALDIACTYRAESNQIISTAPDVFLVRRSNSAPSKKTDETKAEIARVEVVELMKETRDLAEQGNFDGALNNAVKARNLLEDVLLDKPSSVIETLKRELDEMTKFLQSKETYDAKGRSFACSSETSHLRQRFASRGGAEDIRSYATPRMDAYLEQAKAFEKDSNTPIPTADEDEKQELAADPLAGIAPSLSYYLEVAIDALKNVHKIINQRPET